MTETQRKKLADIMLEIKETASDKNAVCDEIYSMMVSVFDEEA